MPPNNQNPSTPPGQFDPNQFDFIMNPPAQKKSLIPGGLKQRLLIFIAGAGIGLVLILILFFTIFGGGDGAVNQLVTVAQRQNEIIRISEEAKRRAGGPQAQKLATLSSTIIATDQKNTVEYMSQNGRKIDAKELSLGKSAKTDEELSAAEQNGRFDEVYVRITLDHLQKYQQSLESVRPELGSQGKEVVEQNLKNIELILEDSQTN